MRDTTEYLRLKERVDRYTQHLQELVNAQSEKLIESETRFRKLLTTMQEGFLTVDGDRRIRFANDRIGDLLGIPPDELVGRDVFDFVDAVSRVHLFTLLSKPEEGMEAASRCELNLMDAEGELLPTQVAATYVAPPRGGNRCILSWSPV